MFTTAKLRDMPGLPGIRRDSAARRGSSKIMNHFQLTDRGSIQLVDGVEQFHFISETFASGRRVRICIRDELFETFEETLMRFPDTLLGSRRKRRQHFVSEKGAYVFEGRNKFAFNAILFFYQSGGILSRPKDVDFETFANELEFFELTDYFPECWTIKTVPVEMPTNPCFRAMWLLFEDPKSSWSAWFVSCISFAFITIATGLFCFETTEIGHVMLCNANANGSHVYEAPMDKAAFCHQKTAWFVLDSVITSWFFFEYFIRLAVAPRKLKFVFSFLGIIDFLALVPYFGILILWKNASNEEVGDFGILLRMLRLIRVLRVLKLAHHIEALRLLGYTIHQCKYLLVGLMLLIAILTISLSTMIYFVEKYNPDAQIRDTMDAAWFVLITITNVGYGDVVPTTVLGKMIGSVATTLGILIVFILPAPVLLNHFEEIYSLRKERRKRKKAEEENKESSKAT